jgi:hypothetical protein
MDYLECVHEQMIEMMPFQHSGLQAIQAAIKPRQLQLNHLFVIQPLQQKNQAQLPSSATLDLEAMPVQQQQQQQELLLSGFRVTDDCELRGDIREVVGQVVDDVTSQK